MPRELWKQLVSRLLKRIADFGHCAHLRWGWGWRCAATTGFAGCLFSYIDLEKRVRADHPLRLIRQIANAALRALSGEFAKLYSPIGRLLQAFYSIRSERQLVDRLDHDLLFRWFVGKRSVNTPGQAATRSSSAGFQCQGSRSAIWRAG
jgi:Transposase domain (DUF772)